MSEGFDIYTIIILVLAVFIFLRLRSVLGTRTGNERRPQDPFAGRPPAAPDAGDKVIPLPQRNSEPQPASPPPADEPQAPRWAGIAEPNTPVARGLDAIAAAEQGFDARGFVGGARAAYEMIVTAFAAGDRKTLKPLLARDVFESFASAIAEREARGETMESNFVSIEKSEITAAEIIGKQAQITVRFVSKLITATRDRDGAVIDGSATEIADLIDVWTFARDVGARDPNWRLVATEPV